MSAIYSGHRSFYWEAACLALIVATQATLLTRIRVFGASPDLLMVGVVCWSLARGVRAGLLWGFVGGVGADLIAGAPIGTSALALLPLPWLSSLGRASIFGNHTLLPAALVALATPLRGWIMLFLLGMRGAQIDWIASTVRVIGPELLLNIALALTAYPALRWLAARLSPAAEV